jgi:carboxylate-amine ligase
MNRSLKQVHNTGDKASDGAFTFGIEEEFFLADARTMSAAAETPDALFRKLTASGAKLGREMLQAQLETTSRPHAKAGAARAELKELREAAAGAAARHDLALLASGTLPAGGWRDAVHTPRERYDRLMEGLQMIGQRNMLCGMHVHVELPDPSRRVEVMARMLPYVPLLLALSTSSPFWESRPTGLKGYRLAAYDELPRTGLPDLFNNEADYSAYLDAMMKSGAIKDGTQVWWSLRPSEKFPTLELRATDSCTRLDDAVAIASLYRVVARHLFRNAHANHGFNAVDRALAVENKWRAQRYGIDASFVTRDGAVPIDVYLDELCRAMRDDIDALECGDEMTHCRSIVAEGSSADAQLRVFRRYEGQGTSAALHAVSRWIAQATVTA